MATPDLRYMLSPVIQMVFRDKRTGLPLRDGYILFFQDSSRSIGKPVYTLDGNPSNYTLIPYGFLDLNGAWRLDLTSYGTIEKALYLYPYDANGVPQLYFMQWYASDNFPQDSREAYPAFSNAVPTPGTVIDVNLAPNGQFLLHTDVVVNPPTRAGKITQAVTPLAYGGYTFQRPSASTAEDFIFFERYGSTTPDVNANPRYSIRIINEAPGAGDTFKDFVLTYNDVNKFASTTDQYTYSFTGQSNAGTGIALQLILIKNFGLGGSTQTEQVLTTFLLSTSEVLFYFSFVFGDNSSKTLGTDDSDFVALALRMPLTTVYDVSINDYILTPGTVVSPVFPQTPTSEFVYQALAGGMKIPNYQSADVYLPLISTPSGITYDSSRIGEVITKSYPRLEIGELSADGSQLETAAFSSDLIPYSRLQQKYYDTTVNYPIYGTGENFNTADLTIAATQNTIRLSTNSPATVADSSDGGTPTGFTFTTIHKNTGSLSFSYINFATTADTTAKVIFYSTYIGTQLAAPSTNVAGWTIIADPRNDSPLNTMGSTGPVCRSIYTLNITGAPAASDYVLWDAYDSGNVKKAIMLWFKVNGVGTQPVVVADVYIELDVLSTYGAVEIAKCVNEAINNRQQTTVLCVAASGITPGSYWNFNSSTNAYYPWYTINGVGVDPLVPGATAIPVALASTDTDIQVALKTQIAINSKYYALPDYQGMILRGIDPTMFWDNGERLSSFSPLPNTTLGTFESDMLLTHDHAPPYPNGYYFTLTGTNNGQTGADFSYTADGSTGFAGGFENRTINTNVFYVIKY